MFGKLGTHCFLHLSTPSWPLKLRREAILGAVGARLLGAGLEKQVHAVGAAVACGFVERRLTSALGGGFEGSGRLGGLLFRKDPEHALPCTFLAILEEVAALQRHVHISEKRALPPKQSTAPPWLRANFVRCALAGSGWIGDSELRGGGLEGLGASVRSSECYDYHRLGATHWDESSTVNRAGDRGLRERSACREMKEAAALKRRLHMLLEESLPCVACSGKGDSRRVLRQSTA